MPPIPQFWNEAGSALVTRLTFDPVTSGEPSAWQTIRLYNAKDAPLEGEMRSVSVYALARDYGATTGYSAAHRAAAESWVEIYASGETGGTGEIAAQETPITKIGASRRLFLVKLPADSYRELLVRLNPPPGSGSSHVEIALEVDFERPSVPISSGFAEAGLEGVELGIGDPAVSYLARGGTITATGTPDEFVTVADRVVVVAGAVYTILAESVETDGLDADSVALASGQAYWITLCDDGSGTVHQVKGAKSTAPLDVDVRPAVPAGEVLLGYVHRDFDAAISTADIDQDALLLGLFSPSSSGLTGYIGQGQALIGNSRINLDYKSSFTLSPSTTNYVWLMFTGDVAVGPTQPAGSRLLFEFVTNASAVTAINDRRLWLPRPTVVELAFEPAANMAVNDYSRTNELPFERGHYLIPVNPMRVFLNDLGTGGATGFFEFDVFASVDGAAEATLYTAAGADRPRIAFDLTARRDVDSLPQITRLSPYAQLRARYIAAPGSISVHPTGARIHILCVPEG